MFPSQKSAAKSSLIFITDLSRNCTAIKKERNVFTNVNSGFYLITCCFNLLRDTHIRGYTIPSPAESHFKLVLHQLAQTVLLNKITPPNRLQQHVRAALRPAGHLAALWELEHAYNMRTTDLFK